MSALPQHTSMTKAQALKDIAFALALAVAAALLVGALSGLMAQELDLPLLLTLPMQGVLVLAGLHLAVRARGQRWRQLGLLRPRLQDLGQAVLALLLVFAVNAVLTVLLSGLLPGVVEQHQQGLSGLAGSLAHGLPLAVVGGSMLFVGFYEELLARGFLLDRCRHLLGGYWGPVLLSSALFGLGHFYQGALGVVQTALVGLVFATLTLRWGSLWPVILAHGAMNTISLLVLSAATAA